MLSKSLIIAKLKELHEHAMARDIFVPILKQMGLQEVKFTGGTSEIGIDIEYFETSKADGRKLYSGIQFKHGELKYGAGGRKDTIKEIKNQAEEAFEKEIHDLKNHSVTYISRFIVATTGEINEPARVYIGQSRKKGQGVTIDYWDGDRLAELIQKYWEVEFEKYFKIEDPGTEQEEDQSVVDPEYIEGNFSKQVKKAKQVKKTITTSQFEILGAILKKCGYGSDPSPVALEDILFELGTTENHIKYDLGKLSEINYLSIDPDENGTFLTLCGHAQHLSNLLGIIQDELNDASEDIENDNTILNEILKYP